MAPRPPASCKQRTERLHPFESLDDVERLLAALIERDLVVHLDRRPGQKEARYAQLLGGDGSDDVPGVTSVAQPLERPEDDRIAALETRIAAVEEQLASLLRSADQD